MKERDVVVALLKELTRAVQAMDDEAFTSLLAKRFRITLSIPAKKKGRSSSDSSHRRDLEEVEEALRKATTRDEGERLLIEAGLSKLALTEFARRLDAPYQKGDSIRQLRARIIEATIGFRLRSAAVQGSDNLPKLPKRSE